MSQLILSDIEAMITMSLDAGQVFKVMLTIVNNELKTHAFRRQGHDFRRFQDGNCAIIWFQKSRDSSKSKVLYYVNYGICYGVLYQVTGSGNFESCHQSESHMRAWLNQNSAQSILEVCEGGSAEEHASEVLLMLKEQAMPFFEAYLPTEAAMLLWKSGHGVGISVKNAKKWSSYLELSDGTH